MRKHYTIKKRFMALLLCIAMVAAYLPGMGISAGAQGNLTAVTGTVVDPSTADSWEHMMGTDADGNRYAGRMWVDKSVYKNGDTVILNSKGEEGSSFQVSLDEDEAFQIIFSALGSTMTTTQTTSTTGPLDVVLILDNSVSMNTTSGGTTRMQKVIESANSLLAELMDGNDVRLGIAAYSEDSSTVLPFGAYDDGVVLRVNSYTGSGSRNGVITAYNNSNQVINSNYKSAGYANYTNTQAGFDLAMQMLAQAQDTAGRKPVVILLTDGAANTAVDTLFDNDRTGTVRQVYYSNDIDPMIALSTLLSAAYNKAAVEDHYGVTPMIYGIGVDLSATDGSNAIIDPGSNFNSSNRNANIREAYETYTQTWLQGTDVSVTSGTGSGWGSSNYTFRFGHEYPQGSAVTDQDIADNIDYVDTYYPVASANLQGVFDQIYQELSSGVFNPISSSSSVSGGTGVDDTPLIYADYIGQYMQIKEIQAITLFGNSYGVVRNGDGSYTVDTATGVNPTTNEKWNTAEDIRITVEEQTDGSQKLEIRINQEILPIIMEKVTAETVGEATTATITEYTQDPLRVYYTVGLDSDILLPGGEVDVSKLQGYEYIDDANGTVSFYSNRFGVENGADSTGAVIKGDAHAGFQPSGENRYYYHQKNQGIFTGITDKSGNEVSISPNNEYGIVWDETQYDLSWMTYAEYQNAQPEDWVYTYVSYYHPTPSATDAASAAEEVTYLVYTNWKYLKESVAFYDATAGVYLNDGKAIAQAEVDSTVAAYMQSNPSAELYAVLGVGSRRTSRLHNMMVDKLSNDTQTAVEHYTPEYLENKSDHYDNDVVVWLGNNGKLTVAIETGIALTKAVTESFGNADDTYALTVTVPDGVAAAPTVVDADGQTVASTYANNVLTVPVKAGQTVYVRGIPGGTQCAIGEIVDGDYYIDSKTDTVTVPLVSQVLSGAAQFAPAVVTNAPNEYGDLFITKEITSDHAVPDSILDTAFTVTVNVGAALAGQSFTVEDNAHSQPYTVTVANDGSLVFQIKARQTIEIFRLPAGTAVTVTEATPDSHFAVSYRTRDYSGATPDADNALVIPSNARSTAVVMNHYTPSPVAVDLDVVIRKDFADASVASRLPGGAFQFLVEKYDGTSWNTVASESVSYNAGEYGEKSATIANVLQGESYTQTGTYSYRVTEVKGNVTNVTYDRTVYTFDVVVTDNGGQLEAKVIGISNTELKDETGDGVLDYITAFNNTYDTAPISVDITKVVENKSGDPTVSAQGFRFEAIAVDQNGQPLDPNALPTNTIFSDAAGAVRISGYYTREQIGTHYYMVYEVNDGKAGWIYSDARYLLTVVVAEDSTSGKLVADMTIEPFNDAAKGEPAPAVADRNKGQLYFTNTYDPQDVSVDLDGYVSKELTGMTLQPDQFSFSVYADGDRSTKVLRGTNELDGDVRFVDFDKALTFPGVGTYRYDIVEDIPAEAVYDAVTGKYVLAGMYYDPTIFDLVVEVSNNAVTGALEANYYFEDAVDNHVTFRNSYRAEPTEYTLGGSKLLRGRAPRNGEFSFSLYQGDTLLQTVSNKADGTFTFDAISYTQAGTHTYTIVEESGNAAGVRYDGVNAPVTVKVTVTDTNGVLSARADVTNSQICFENTYEPKAAQVVFNGTKTLEGGTLTDNAFTFRLYRTDNTFDVTAASAELVGSTGNENGAFAFTRSLDATGTYYFVVLEDAEQNTLENVVYDRTQHQFAVRVSDIGDGQLRAVVTNMATGASSVNGASVSASLSFTNAHSDEVTEKEVYLAGTTTEIDGQKVREGDTLTYFITYTNYNGVDVVADIMDTIPQHTTYVEGSASHSGTYAGTHLNWILSVPRGESVTVSFQVTVDETEAIVANTAVVRDGVNTYYTNEVVNHTVDNPLVKDVFAPEDVTASIDGKKVYEGDTLVYKISFTNATAQAVDLTVTDTIPANSTYVAGSADNGGVYADGKVVWELANVAAWETVTVAFQVTVNAQIGAQTIENKATATDGANQFATDVVTNYTVDDPVVKSVLAADGTTVIDGKKVNAGDVLTYTITYENTAQEAATVTITDTLPQHTTYVDGSAGDGNHADGVITWTKTVDAGASVTVSFQVTVDAADVFLDNRATVQEGKNTYQTNVVTNHSFPEGGQKDVALATEPTVSIDGKLVSVGQILQYTISYTNTTSAPVDVTVTDTIPACTKLQDAKDGTVNGNEISWQFAAVQPRQTVTATFCVEVTGGGELIENQASIFDGENKVTNKVTNSIPGKTVDKEHAAVGETVRYTLAYRNTTGKTAKLVITDKLSDKLDFVAGSAGDGVYENGTLTWTFEDVRPGQIVSVSFQAVVNAKGLNGNITNQAQFIENDAAVTLTPETDTKVDPPKEDPKEDPKDSPKEETKDETKPTPVTPETGDNFRLGLFATMLTLSAFGIAAVVICKKRDEAAEQAE